jgi:hypothetical protein
VSAGRAELYGQSLGDRTGRIFWQGGREQKDIQRSKKRLSLPGIGPTRTDGGGPDVPSAARDGRLRTPTVRPAVRGLSGSRGDQWQSRGASRPGRARGDESRRSRGIDAAREGTTRPGRDQCAPGGNHETGERSVRVEVATGANRGDGGFRRSHPVGRRRPWGGHVVEGGIVSGDRTGRTPHYGLPSQEGI